MRTTRAGFGGGAAAARVAAAAWLLGPGALPSEAGVGRAGGWCWQRGALAWPALNQPAAHEHKEDIFIGVSPLACLLVVKLSLLRRRAAPANLPELVGRHVA
jgi:hypothetical protein